MREKSFRACPVVNYFFTTTCNICCSVGLIKSILACSSLIFDAMGYPVFDFLIKGKFIKITGTHCKTLQIVNLY